MTHPMAKTLQNIADPWFREISESSNLFMYFSSCEYIFQGLLLLCYMPCISSRRKKQKWNIFCFPVANFCCYFFVHLEKCNVLGLWACTLRRNSVFPFLPISAGVSDRRQGMIGGRNGNIALPAGTSFFQRTDKTLIGGPYCNDNGE